MINGDISNETPPRIIVVVDVVAEITLGDKKLFKKQDFKVKWKKEILKGLWDFSFRYGISMELAGIEEDGWTDDMLSDLMGKLDNRGGNPFNYYYVYDDVQELVDELPYKANFKGVVDLPNRILRYGSWGIDIKTF